MAFEWDATKNSVNFAKHGIDFRNAMRIFEGPVLEILDTRRDYGETRVIVFGVVAELELVVVYTMRGKRRRIISARRAHSREREAYREAYGKH
jgi:uncharacterized DUF497 family protein